MKKNIFKLVVFFLIIGVLHLLVDSFTPRMTFGKLELLDSFLKKPVDVLIFGDSSNWYASKNDKDKRTISEMLENMMPGCSVKSITHGAYHMEVYAAFCQYIVRQKRQPGIIIIPINMRTFSPEWDMNPRYQFTRQRIILEGGLKLAFYKPMRVLKYKFKTITRKEYLELPVYDGSQKIGKLKRMKGPKKQFILKYIYSLSDGHRKVKSLLKITRLLSKNNIQMLFYLTPIDYQEGERRLPGRFKKQLNHNTTFLCSLISKESLLDLSLDLTRDYFAWKEIKSVNEHLNQEGRRYVAKKLAEKLNVILTKKGK
jgi:hypothetical protein